MGEGEGRRCVRGRTQIVGFAGKRFLHSPPPPPSFLFFCSRPNFLDELARNHLLRRLKNLQPTFFMIFPSQLNGRLVRRGFSGFASDMEDRIIPWDSNTPPHQKKIPGPKFNPQNVSYRISKPLKFSESIKWYSLRCSRPTHSSKPLV